MKKIILSAIIIVSLLATVGTVFAVKPNGNLSGATKVPWNLSGEVMPVPPYGSMDIPGSDTASKLIVNQPNGATKVTMTGVMNGLNPNTTYTVYLSNGYTPYVFTGWNVVGNWIVSFNYQGSSYNHDMTLSQTGNALTGSGGYPVGGPYQYPWAITEGSINGNQVHLKMDYTAGVPFCSMTMDGTIASDGTMVNGNWSDNCWGQNRTGTWVSASGQAMKTHTGDTGWPGLLTSTVQPFTFTTDAYGAGSWHVNLKDADFLGERDYTLSVWINESGRTMLISDSFTVTVD